MAETETIFTKIIRGEIPAAKVYEDEHTLAFLDIAPLARGHTLVIPKRPAKLVQDMTPEDQGHLFHAVGEVARKVQKATGAPSTTIAVNNGPEAGQEVPHVHVHVIPRTEGDGAGPIHALRWPRPDVSREELPRIAEEIRNA